MIKKLTSLEPHTDFIHGFYGDPDFSEPMLVTEEEIEVNLNSALDGPHDHLMGVFEGGVLTGLFVFLIIEEEKYIEMIVGLSRSEAAYGEAADWLAANYPGFQADFVFNPRNTVLAGVLRARGAMFDTEQQRMVLEGGRRSMDTAGIVPLGEANKAQYVAIHATDCYWTGEKVAAEQGRFRTFVAMESGRAVGYIDVTALHDENEIFDLRVLESSRRRGWGRKLLEKALEANHPHGMMLMVEVDNSPAIALYESAGFVKKDGQNSVLAVWHTGDIAGAI